MPLLLLVEDERKLLDGLQRGLKDEGFDVLRTGSGEEGFYLATTEPVDAVVLDVMLPGRDGFQVLRDLRRQGFCKPILMLSRTGPRRKPSSVGGSNSSRRTSKRAFARHTSRTRQTATRAWMCESFKRSTRSQARASSSTWRPNGR